MLTPLDIETKEFKKKVWGYSEEEVDEFLDSIVENYESLYRENVELKDKVNVLNEGIQNYKSLEDTLKNTLLVAQSTGEDLKRNALEKSENIIKEAEMKAAKIISDANQEVTKVRFEYEELIKNYNVFKAKFENQLVSQMEIIKNGISVEN